MNFAGLASDIDCREGIILIDKPLGLSSFGVVARVRRLLGVKKVGHTGTLDPLATGLLIVLVGKATKRCTEFIADGKVYRACICLGSNTSGDDREGNVTKRWHYEHIDETHIREILPLFLGAQLQTPPIFSAKKINGIPCHRKARAGICLCPPPQKINIYRIDFCRYQAPLLEVEIECSKGTYVRAVARDIGTKLGCGAHIHNLRRTQSGNFSVQNAISLVEVAKHTHIQ
ncbi:MAG: tRNA pseudouridine(55) synthase TruB [Puniceicoccales bacterium]|jgi:tRNA pseudouridine55 synthase|nr:tRNA pseudouridine(55) synthase TruB [Puniceicoccales bacterium]